MPAGLQALEKADIEILEGGAHAELESGSCGSHAL